MTNGAIESGNPWKQAAVDELMIALTGCTTIPQAMAWLVERMR